jgi:SAM-dependent methyltransferase
MREIPFEDEFDAVINVFTSFGYLETEDEDRKVLREVHKALKPGGWFLLEVANHDDLMRRYATPTVETDPLEDGTVVVWRSRFDPLPNRYEAHGVLRFPDGRTGEAYHSCRSYALLELVDMLEGMGLSVRACSGVLDGGELSLESRRLVIVSQKTGPAR